MKVLIDTNIWLSYLLSTARPSAITTVVVASLTQDAIEVLVPQELITELAAKVATKRYFSTRIPRAMIDAFIEQLTALAEQPPPLEQIPPHPRGSKDGYLVAYGIVNEADYLITGDADLLVLGQVGALQIIRPSNFVYVLRRHGLIT